MNIYESLQVFAPHPGGNTGPENKSVKFILLLLYTYDIFLNNMNF